MSENDIAKSMAESMGLVDGKESDAYQQIYQAINAINENHVDTGYGMDGMDLWVTINEREYFINVKPSSNQVKKESQ